MVVQLIRNQQVVRSNRITSSKKEQALLVPFFAFTWVNARAKYSGIYSMFRHKIGILLNELTALTYDTVRANRRFALWNLSLLFFQTAFCLWQNQQISSLQKLFCFFWANRRFALWKFVLPHTCVIPAMPEPSNFQFTVTLWYRIPS